MKRLVVFITVLALILSISATAFAAEQNMQLGSKDIEVTAKQITTTTVPTVYSVDIQWDSMIFTYTETIRKTWKPENHSYEKNSDKKWDETTAQITVTNHSNAAVNVAMTYTAEDGSGVTGTLSNATAALAAGVEGKYGEADSVTATLTVGGTPSESVISAGLKIGTIRITVS